MTIRPHLMRRAVSALPWRPGLGLRAAIAAAGIVVIMAVIVSDAVANHLRQTATDAALRSVEAIVRGYVDPVLREESLDLGARRDPAIDDQLRRLSLSGDIRLINVWSRDGSVAFSSLPEIRERRFSIGADLARAFAGESVTHYSSAGTPATPAGDAAGLDRYLQVFVPIRGAVDGGPIGVYEVFQDAGPIEDRVEATRRDVFVVALVAATILLGLLWLTFAGASQALSRQNQLLRERAATERLLAEDLRRSEERFRSLVRNSSDVILILDAGGRVAYESSAVERVLGYSVAERMGQKAFEILHPDDAARGEYFLAEVLQDAGTEALAELRARHADGSWRILQAVAKNLIDDPAVGGIVINYRDVSDRKALEEQLRHQAFHDGLTGLANRALFSDRLDHALTRRSKDERHLAVLFIDLDDFKAVNDTLGHISGDRLLISVADRLRNTLRTGDTAARMGGDEFAVLLDDADDATDAETIAERIVAAIRRPYAVGAKEATIRASVGVAHADIADESADELLRNADLAMYMAKSQGKDRVVVYEPRHGDLALSRLRMKADLDRAFDRDEFRVVYQPIIDLASQATTGFEALLRWTHPRRGAVSPVEFIPLAEENGLIVPLGRWVLQEACRNAREWGDRDGVPLRMSVNLSARQLQEPGLIGDVERTLIQTGLPPERLTLEITETVLMRDVPLAIDSLAKLRQLGVRVAIDDFGTGYSSLSYLQQFPIDTLKIDRSFVAALDGSSADAALVSSIVRLAGSLHLETVAEGIEEAGQLDALRKLGAGLGQGFFFARPLERDSVQDYLDEAHARGPVEATDRRGIERSRKRPRRNTPTASPGRLQQSTDPSLIEG